MPRYWHRMRGVHAVSIGPTGHVHTETEPDAQGYDRIVIDCSSCANYLSPVDFSIKQADIVLSYDEEQGIKQAEEREKRLSPEIAEIVARVVAEMHNVRPSPVQSAPTEEMVLRAVREQLAREHAATPALSTQA